MYRDGYFRTLESITLDFFANALVWAGFICIDLISQIFVPACRSVLDSVQILPNLVGGVGVAKLV